VATGKPIGEPLVHSHPVLVLAFSPDGKKLLTGTLGGEGQEKAMKGAIRLWEADTGKAVGESLDHRAGVVAVAFSPDGSKFLTVSIREAQSWDTANRERVGPPLRHVKSNSQGQPMLSAILCGALSPDG